MSGAAIVASLFARGHACDLVLLVMAIECVVLSLRGRRLAAIGCAILPGAFMMLALRAALTGAAWPWIAGPLALSLPVHLADLHRRGWFAPRRR